MSHEIKLHAAQTNILRELLFVPQANFAQLQKPTGLGSDHFMFHVNRLMELGFVDKVGRGQYLLTSAGKEYANRLDTDNNTVERQPKAAVVLNIKRPGNNNDYLFQQRLKHPYFGYWGRPTGKIRWGETIVETAARELAEETGLTANFKIKGIHHEIVYDADHTDILEDKIFFNVACTEVQGKLQEHFEGGHNRWMTLDEVLGQQKVFANFDVSQQIWDGQRQFVESRRRHPKTEF